MDQDYSSSAYPQQQEDAINLRHYWHVVLERRWLVIAVFISVFVLSLIYLFKATPIYQAVARMEIEQEFDNILRVEGLTMNRQEQDYLQTQYKKLMSPTLLELVINQLRLDKDERYKDSVDIVRALAADVTVVPIRLSRLVDIRVEHSNPKRAAEIANTLVKTFIDQNLSQKMEAANEVVDRLKVEENAQKQRLEAAEKALHAYSAKHQQVSFEETEDIIIQALRMYQAEYVKARSEAAARQKLVDEIDTMMALGAPIDTIPEVAKNPDIQAMKRELALLEAAFAELKKKYKSKYPLYEQAEARIAALRSALTNHALALIEAARNSARIAKETEERLGELVKEQEQEQLRLNELRIQYSVLKREAEENGLLYKTVLARTKEAELNSRNKINNMRIVDPAKEPLRPVKPRVVVTLFLGVAGGLAVALGLAFFVNYLDDSIKSQDDIETYLRLPFLGYVPNIKTNSVVERDLQAHSQPQSNAAEGFRTIRATISLTHKPDKFRILAVTSTIPSEGKSLVCSNLAIVTAQTGLKTLLVDADMRRPSVHKAYQLHSPNGLSSFLTDDVVRIEDIVHTTEVPNLEVVCCGAVPNTPSELIGSKRMTEFLQAARSRYDRVILDCPPISAVSDPLILSAMSDGVIFVTKFNKIRREHARKSVQRLQNAGIHILGVVINDIDFEGKDSYYYNYYYYQNRYYSSHYRGMATGGGGESAPALTKSRNGE